MAEINKNAPFMEFPLSISRQGAFPIDKASVYYSLADAQEYASNNPTSYPGQPIAVVLEDQNRVDFYIIQIDGTLKQAGGTAAIVKATNPQNSDYNYDLGQVWINSATKKIWFLVDNTQDAAVWVRSVTPDELEEVASGGMLASVYANEPGAGAETGKVNQALKADKLTNAQNIELTGDVTGTASFDGSAAAQIEATIKDSGVIAGTYAKVTVDSKGIVTEGSALEDSDIPSLTLSKITDAGTAAAANLGTSSGNVPVLGSDGKLDTSVIPSLAIKDTVTVANQAAMLELTSEQVQKGDVCIVTDESKTYILSGDDPSQLGSWTLVVTPLQGVQSVNSKTGAVTLTTTDIPEGEDHTNKYYTEGRFDASLATKTTDNLAEGETNKYFTDQRAIDAVKSVTLILNGGDAAGNN